MSYIEKKLTGQDARAQAADTSPTGPNMPEVAPSIERLELECSSFADPGPDWCEWIAYDKSGAVIGRRFMSGY